MLRAGQISKLGPLALVALARSRQPYPPPTGAVSNPPISYPKPGETAEEHACLLHGFARELRRLRGSLNTITLQNSSQPSLVVNDVSRIPNTFYRAKVDLPWTEWDEILASLPQGALRDRLRAAEGRSVQKELQRGVLADTLARGENVNGATLVKGQHVRLR